MPTIYSTMTQTAHCMLLRQDAFLRKTTLVIGPGTNANISKNLTLILTQYRSQKTTT